jgi:N-acetyl-gamma-glutamyl-phosphate reductase
MVRVGITGATGYTGIELVHLLHRHQDAHIVWLTSESHCGQNLSEIHPVPWLYPLITLEEAYSRAREVDVVFLCLPHGHSVEAAVTFIRADCAVIDLSADFRLDSAESYKRWYGIDHPAPELLPSFVYGLCEVYREQLKGARRIAVPGCYPTSVNLALYPLAAMGLLAERVIVDSKSGISGAGRSLKLPYLFAEANENMSPYSVGYRHRHIAEMELILNGVSKSTPCRFTFSPHLLPVTRGILSTIYVRLTTAIPERDVRALYRESYEKEPFIHLLTEGHQATLRHAVHSNRCAISITSEVPTDEACHDFIIVAAIDNLRKGASGQAVQCFNIAHGFPEESGLV